MDLQCDYMRSRLIRIGNSRGVRLPKPLIAEAGLDQEVEIVAREGEIVIRPAQGTRSGWEEAARELHRQGGDTLLDSPSPTRFDQKDWKW